MTEEYLDIFKEEYESNKKQHQEENKEYEEIKALVLSDFQELHKELIKIEIYLGSTGINFIPEFKREKPSITIKDILKMTFEYESTTDNHYFISVQADGYNYELAIKYIDGIVRYSDGDEQQGYPDFIKEAYQGIGIVEQKNNFDEVKKKIIRYLARAITYNKYSVDSKLNKSNNIETYRVLKSLRL